MRRYFHDSRNLKRWRSIAVASFVAFGLLLASNILIAGASTPLDVGYFDFFFPRGTGKNDEATGEKPESKVWYHDGLWWGSLWSETGNSYHIYQLDWDTQTWLDTGVALDDRPDSRADVLVDGNKLYVVSHLFAGTAELASVGSRGEVFRYTYSGGTYSLDEDFPVEVTDSRGEAHVIAKDGTGRLWVAYVTEGKVKVAYSNADGGGDTDWSDPFQLPVSSSTVSSDDIASIIAYDGYVGVMWSLQAGDNRTMRFASHQDGAPPTEWTETAAYTLSGDDHISMRGLQDDDAGRLFALVKTSDTAAHVLVLLVCDAEATSCSENGDWKSYPVYSEKTGDPTRGVMVIDTSNRDIYVFTRLKLRNGGDIYYKKSDLDNILFPEGLGTPIISSADFRSMNNVSTTRQNVTADSGVVILASDDSKQAYVHGCLDLGTTGSLTCLSPNSVIGTRYSSDVYQVNESDGVSLTVTVENPVVSAVPISIDYATVDGTATAGQDYVPVSGTLVFSTGVTSQTFEIGILNDFEDEGPETITLTLTNGPTVFPDTAVVTIFDDDLPPEVSFAAPTFEGLEDLKAGEVTVELNVPYYKAVTVDYATSNGTATSPADFTAAAGTVTFLPGETTKSFDITLVDDGELEVTEFLNLTLSNPVSGTLGAQSTATLSIIDDDDPPDVMLTSDSYSIAEDGGSGFVTVELSETADGVVTVDYGMTDITAVSPADYTSIPTTTLTFAPGETIKQIEVFVHDDALQEFSETARFGLENAVGANLVEPERAIVAILDDDTPPVVRFTKATHTILEDKGWVEVEVELSFPFDATMTVDYAMTDVTTTAGKDYTPLNGTLIFNPFETVQSILVPITEDQNYELPETLNIQLSNPSITTLSVPNKTAVTIYDNDTPPSVSFANATQTVDESVGLATVSLKLDATSYQTTTVRVVSVDGTAVSPEDFTSVDETVTFLPNTTIATMTVPIADGPVLEPAEAFSLTLAEPQNMVLGSQTTTAITINDNDAPPLVSFVNPEYEVRENVGTAEIAVKLSAPAIAPVTVHYQSSDVTALGDEDYAVISDTLTFAVGETEKPIELPILDDVLEENNETLSLTLSNVGGGDLGTPNVATVIILDNEVPPVAQFEKATYTTDEGVGLFSVNVLLTNPSEDVVTVDYTVVGGTAVAGQDVAASSGTVTFPPGVTSKSVSIAITSDDEHEEAETFELVLSNWVNSLSGSRARTEITITDDDPAPVAAFAGFTYAALESENSVELSVLLSHPSSTAVSVDYTLINGTATKGIDYNGSDGTLTFQPGETEKTFTIIVLDDQLDEDNETLFVNLLNPVNSTLGVPDNVAVTIVDDDATPVVSFATDSYTVSEGGVTAVVEVNLTAASGKTVVVPFELNSSTATLGQDFLLGGVSQITFVPGETNEKFTIQILDDQLAELAETIVIQLVEPDNVIMGTPNVTTITIEDNEPSGVQFDQVEMTVAEGDGEATITVSVTKPQATPFSVNLVTSDGTAKANEDYQPVVETLNFAANEQTKQVVIPLIDDALDEERETILLTLSAPNGVQLGLNTFMEIEITDNDGQPSITFEKDGYRAYEGNEMVELAVRLSTPSGKPITINYATADGSATADSDYTATSGSLQFAAGEVRKTIVIPLLIDGVDENEEIFFLTLAELENVLPGQYMSTTIKLREGEGVLIYLPTMFR